MDGSESEDPLAPAADEGDPLAQGDPADVTPANAPQAPQDMAAVLEQMAVMRAELDQFRSGNITPPNGQNGTNAAPAPQIPDGQPKIPDYMFDVPDQIMAAMASEDPVQRKEGVKHLLGGIGRTIHRNLVQELTRAQAQIPQIVQGIVKEQAYQQKIHDDFYGNYKELNAPHLIPVVTATFAELLQQGKVTQGWNDKNRDTIAKEVYRRLGRAFPVKGQSTVPPKAPVPPRMIGGNRAPGAGTPTNNTADEIARTFS